jgi:hypothetical protein
MDKDEMIKMVDAAGEADYQIKKAIESLDKLKDKLKTYASQHKVHTLTGISWIAKVTDTSTTSIKPYTLYEYLNGDIMFFDLVNTKIVDVRNMLGEKAINDIGTIEELEYNRISFKPNDKRDDIVMRQEKIRRIFVK